jgi:hypothetical protein
MSDGYHQRNFSRIAADLKKFAHLEFSPNRDGKPNDSSARIEAMIVDWEDTARVNLTGVGRAYAICARDLRIALTNDGS